MFMLTVCLRLTLAVFSDFGFTLSKYNIIPVLDLLPAYWFCVLGSVLFKFYETSSTWSLWICVVTPKQVDFIYNLGEVAKTSWRKGERWRWSILTHFLISVKIPMCFPPHSVIFIIILNRRKYQVKPASSIIQALIPLHLVIPSLCLHSAPSRRRERKVQEQLELWSKGCLSVKILRKLLNEPRPQDMLGAIHGWYRPTACSDVGGFVHI